MFGNRCCEEVYSDFNCYNETHYLSHLDKIIHNKITNADHMINKFSKDENLTELYDK